MSSTFTVIMVFLTTIYNLSLVCFVFPVLMCKMLEGKPSTWDFMKRLKRCSRDALIHFKI